MLTRVLLVSCAVLLLAQAPAYGDVGVVLNESLDTGGDRISSTGHSAVYLSRVCAETPVKLRMCRPGEAGSVLSTYTGFGETQPFEWNVVPLGVFLYGAEDPRGWTLVGSAKIKRALEEHYRENHLSPYCSGPPCTTSDKADWRDMVGAGLSRNIYIFVVETTVEQDRELVEKLNSLPNENHFNAVTRNCADFTRSVIRIYFPHATSPDYLNDFGMSTPKAMARSFTRYALRHPEMKFHVLHFSQVPGTIKRSRKVRDATEQLYRSKLFPVPIVLFAVYALPAAAVSYELTGRFNPDREWEKHPTVQAAEITGEIRAVEGEKDKVRIKQLEAAERRERARVLGTAEDWKAYRKELDLMVAEAVRQRIIPDRNSLHRVFKELDKAGTPSLDAGGELWMEVSAGGQTSKVGLSASNILSPGSDTLLAYRVILARIDRMLNSPKHSRETLLVFKKNWALLEAARRKNALSVASGAGPATSGHAAGMPTHAPGMAPGGSARGSD